MPRSLAGVSHPELIYITFCCKTNFHFGLLPLSFIVTHWSQKSCTSNAGYESLMVIIVGQVVGVVGDNVVDLSMAKGLSCLVSPYRMRKKIAYGQHSFGRIICDMMALGWLLSESKVCGICYYLTHSGGRVVVLAHFPFCLL
jgi:hypothetical protein